MERHLRLKSTFPILFCPQISLSSFWNLGHRKIPSVPKRSFPGSRDCFCKFGRTGTHDIISFLQKLQEHQKLDIESRQYLKLWMSHTQIPWDTAGLGLLTAANFHGWWGCAAGTDQNEKLGRDLGFGFF